MPFAEIIVDVDDWSSPSFDSRAHAPDRLDQAKRPIVELPALGKGEAIHQIDQNKRKAIGIHRLVPLWSGSLAIRHRFSPTIPNREDGVQFPNNSQIKVCDGF
jgi:hypothetical protein